MERSSVSFPDLGARKLTALPPDEFVRTTISFSGKLKSTPSHPQWSFPKGSKIDLTHLKEARHKPAPGQYNVRPKWGPPKEEGGKGGPRQTFVDRVMKEEKLKIAPSHYNPKFSNTVSSLGSFVP